jgi:hypothetical protein
MPHRKHQRYDLEATLNFGWQGEDGALYWHQGFTRDISAGGVFVWADRLPPPRANVQIEVFISSLLPRSILVIRGEGQVVRVAQNLPDSQDDTERTGFAAAIDTFTLRNEEGELVD